MFVDAAQALIEKVVPQPLPKDRDVALLKAQEILLAFGITATADMGTTLDDWLTYRRMGDRGALRVRIMSYGAGRRDRDPRSAAAGRRRGCTATGCGWAGSSSTPTARWDRAARGCSSAL